MDTFLVKHFVPPVYQFNNNPTWDAFEAEVRGYKKTLHPMFLDSFRYIADNKHKESFTVSEITHLIERFNLLKTIGRVPDAGEIKNSALSDWNNSDNGKSVAEIKKINSQLADIERSATQLNTLSNVNIILFAMICAQMMYITYILN